MVKANLKKALEEARKGEGKTREYPNEEREKIAKVLVAKSTLKTGKNKQFIEENLDKEKALQILNIQPEIYEEIKENEKQESLINIKERLRELFFELIKAFDYYMDDTPENIMFYSIWTIGTYFHNQFSCYPYLFLNAMRGSGKSRLLRLISYLGNGKYTGSITEPIIFRTDGLLCIDELESIGGKDKTALRELLNASYKKGMTIMRVIKKKGIDGDNMKIEEFEPYRPIAMANIWGMDDVLGDRCITRVLEKSNNPLKTKRIENFELNPTLNYIKVNLVKCSVCSVDVKKTQELWNQFLDNLHLYTNNTNYTNYTNYTFSEQENKFFNKINETNIFGRNLELFLPLFCIANLIGEDIFNNMIDIGKKLSNEKKESEMQESSDVLVYSFISTKESSLDYISIKELFYQFKDYSQLEGEWFNDRWFGKSLKRLNLIISKRRLSRGMEVILNVNKAKEKLKIFK